MIMIDEKILIRKKLFISMLIGMLFSLTPSMDARIASHEDGPLFKFIANARRRTWTSEQDKKDTLKAQSYQFYAAFVLEILATLAEGFNINAMGSTSAETIKKAGLASAAAHGIRSMYNVAEYAVMPTTRLPNTDFSRTPSALFTDTYFLFKDKKKIEKSNELATFYKQHKKHTFKVRNKRWTQAALLILSTSLRMYLYASLGHEFSKGAQTSSAYFHGEKLPYLLPTILVCDTIDFFRKQARYNAELSEQFEDWLWEQRERKATLDNADKKPVQAVAPQEAPTVTQKPKDGASEDKQNVAEKQKATSPAKKTSKPAPQKPVAKEEAPWIPGSDNLWD